MVSRAQRVRMQAVWEEKRGAETLTLHSQAHHSFG